MTGPEFTNRGTKKITTNVITAKTKATTPNTMPLLRNAGCLRVSINEMSVIIRLITLALALAIVMISKKTFDDIYF